MSGDTFTSNRFKWLEAITADSRLHSTAIRVAVVIASHLNRQSGEAFPSIKTIAAKSATPERSVERAVADLCKAGYLERRRGGFSQPNRYLIPETSPHRCAVDPVSIPATGGGNDVDSPAMDGGNENTIPAMGGGSVPPPVADHSRHGWRTNPLNEPFEKEPKEERYSTAREREAAALARQRARPSLDWKTAFDEFWKQYPRKVGKGAAEKAFKTALKATNAETIIAGCLRFSAIEHAAYGNGKDAQYTPHAATWLNRRSWEDEPDPVVTPIHRPAPSNADRKSMAADVAQRLKGYGDKRRSEESRAPFIEPSLLRVTG